MTTFERARLYLAAMPPGISGQNGHGATFSAAIALRHGFGLPDNEAWELLLEFNQRCQPVWNLEEIRHKFNSVDSVKHPKNKGHLAERGAVKPFKVCSHLPAFFKTPIISPQTPKVLGVIKLSEHHSSPLPIEEAPIKTRVERILPSRPSVPVGLCPVCWERWGRSLKIEDCICTGAVRQPFTMGVES